MTVTEIAAILDIPPETLREDIASRHSPASRAYLRGKTTAKVSLRRQEMQLAAVGSPMAVENSRQALFEMEDDEV